MNDLETVNSIINHKFNMFENSEMHDFGNLTPEEVQQFNSAVLLPEWNNILTGRAFEEFTTTTQAKLEDARTSSQSNLLKKGAEYLHFKIKQRRLVALHGFEANTLHQPFDLRGMLFSMLSMTEMTAGEKLASMWGMLKDGRHLLASIMERSMVLCMASN